MGHGKLNLLRWLAGTTSGGIPSWAAELIRELVQLAQRAARESPKRAISLREMSSEAVSEFPNLTWVSSRTMQMCIDTSRNDRVWRHEMCLRACRHTFTRRMCPPPIVFTGGACWLVRLARSHWYGDPIASAQGDPRRASRFGGPGPVGGRRVRRHARPAPSPINLTSAAMEGGPHGVRDFCSRATAAYAAHARAGRPHELSHKHRSRRPNMPVSGLCIRKKERKPPVRGGVVFGERPTSSYEDNDDPVGRWRRQRRR